MKAAILCNIPCENICGGSESREELLGLLKQNGYEVFVGGVFTEQTEELTKDKPLGVFPIYADRNSVNPIGELKTLLSTASKIRKNKIDHVIVYGIKNHSSMALGAAIGGAKKILCVVNGRGNLFRIGGVKGRIIRMISFPLLKLSYRLAHAVCFQNVDDRDYFIKKRLLKDPEKAFVTNGSGVNLERFCQTPLTERQRFLYLARITPTKGIKEYIEAAKIVKEKYPEAVFDAVGPMDRAVEGSTEQLVTNACKSGVISYHGATDDVPAWMEKCRCFVYPSYYPEGVPRCALQAAACGRPVIACDTPGCRETVVDGVSGFVVEPQSPEMLAEKMVWMIQNPEKLPQMAEASRRLAEQKFDVNEVNKEILKHLA